jgi:signal transduction histidine kinase/DNA-binding response OmpR family regulator/AraC-like DNA-binding protein/Txe/YoeB family toxin of Txe-Axe toxin-antitoxin module
MKRAYLLFLTFVLHLPSVLQGQNAQLSSQLDQLWQKFQKDLVPFAFHQPPCALNSLKEINPTQRDVSFWLHEGAKMRHLGAYDCGFQLLAELEPSARIPRDKGLWLYEKIALLLVIDKLEEAQVLVKQLSTLAEKSEDIRLLALISEAELASDKRQFQHALDFGEKALVVARQNKDKKQEASILSLIGNTSRDIYMVKPEKYAPFYHQALAIDRNLKDTARMIYQLTSLSMSQLDTGNLQEAARYLLQGFDFVRPDMSIKEVFDLSKLLAGLLYSARDFDRALAAYQYAIAVSKRMGMRASTQNLYEQMVGIYEEKRDYKNALSFMDSAKAYCDFNRELGYFYRSYANIYAHLGEKDKSIEYYRLAFEEQIKGYGNRNSALLTEMETKMRTQETALELAQQKQVRWFLLGIAVLATLLFSGAFWAFLRNKKQIKILRGQKELIEQQEIELRKLDAAKTRFFANVSHELRTPLTLILSPLSNLLKTNELSNKQFTLLSLVRQNVQDLLKLVNEILDLNKLEAGKLGLQEETVVLYGLVRRLVANFESHAERQNIHLTFDYQLDKYIQLLLDRNKFEKIINNLISNALKFTQQGGSISLSVLEKPNAIEIQVKDTGRGIHPDDLPHVFNRFYQSNQADAPTEGGTGIGLSLSMEFAKLLKGRLWVTSILGQGSTFYFSFPKREVLKSLSTETVEELNQTLIAEEAFVSLSALTSSPPQKSIHPAVYQTSETDVKTILVVEDNRSLSDYLKMILQDQFHVLTAENGLAALDILQNQIKKNPLSAAQNPVETIPTPSVDLIISDIMMPVMDGFQFLEVLKSRAYFQQIPVIMLTARADIQDKLKALRIGVDDYLLKPFEEDELFARIHNLLKNSQLRQVFKQESESLLLKNIPNTVHRTPMPTGLLWREGSGEGDIFIHPEDAVRIPSENETDENQKWLIELEQVVQKQMPNFDLTAESIADDLAMSRAQFFRRLKLATGLTPHQYLLELRFNHARQLLELRKENSVKAVAYSVGMRDVKYFSQQFKERFGRLPSDYLLAKP